jgi:hypothetical protein
MVNSACSRRARNSRSGAIDGRPSSAYIRSNVGDRRSKEAALQEVRMAEEALAQQASPPAIAQMAMGKALNDKVVSLAGRLPQIWADKATTDAQRKALLRCLVDKVVLERGEHDVALVRVVWRGGAVTELEVKMKVNSIAKLTRGMEHAR